MSARQPSGGCELELEEAIEDIRLLEIEITVANKLAHAAQRMARYHREEWLNPVDDEPSYSSAGLVAEREFLEALDAYWKLRMGTG